MSRPNDVLGKSDAELVRLSLQNQDNFLFIVQRYETKLLRYIRRISGVSAEDAEDVLQEVFIKVYLKLNDFDPDLKFSSWIYRITHNQVISHYRWLKARPVGLALGENSQLIDSLISSLNLEADVELALLRADIYKVLNRLDEKYREVIVLKYFEDKNYREISDILKKPMGTVGTLLNKAKDKFRAEFERHKDIHVQFL